MAIGRPLPSCVEKPFSRQGGRSRQRWPSAAKKQRPTKRPLFSRLISSWKRRHRPRTIQVTVGSPSNGRFRVREVMTMFIQLMINVRCMRRMDMRHNRCLEMMFDTALRRVDDRRRHVWWAMHGILLLSSSRLLIDNTSL